jgi:hypothetical protein
LVKTSEGVLNPKHFIGVALILFTTLSMLFCVAGGANHVFWENILAILRYADNDEKPGFPFNQDRYAHLALPGNNGVSLPMADLFSHLNRGGALGYVDTVGYFGNFGFFAGRPFVPLFMASYQVCDEIPAFRVNPQVD